MAGYGTMTVKRKKGSSHNSHNPNGNGDKKAKDKFVITKGEKKSTGKKEVYSTTTSVKKTPTKAKVTIKRAEPKKSVRVRVVDKEGKTKSVSTYKKLKGPLKKELETKMKGSSGRVRVYPTDAQKKKIKERQGL